MKTLIILSLLFAPLLSFGQSDYNTYLGYADTANIRLNRNIISTLQFELQDDGKWVKFAEERYNVNGLPVSVALFRPDGKTEEKKEFTYDEHGCIREIDTYEPDHYSIMYKDGIPDSTKTNEHTEKSKFETTTTGQITRITEYIYSSIGNDSTAIWTTLVEYYPDRQVRKKIKLSNFKKDTDEIQYFDPTGCLSRTEYKKQMFSIVREDYIFNDDKSEMKEIQYNADSTIFETIVHKYLHHLEVEKQIPLTHSLFTGNTTRKAD